MDTDRREEFKAVLGKKLEQAHRKLYGAHGIAHLTWWDVVLATIITVAVAATVLGFYEMIGWFASWG